MTRSHSIKRAGSRSVASKWARRQPASEGQAVDRTRQTGDLVRRVEAALHAEVGRHPSTRGEVEALDRAAAVQAQVISRAHEAVAVLDEAGQVVSWNAGAARLYGRPAQDMVGQRFERLFELPQRVALARKLADTASGSTDLELRLASPEGKGAWLLLSLSRIAGVDQGSELVVVHGLDITTRRLAEEGLRDALARSRTLSERLFRLSRSAVGVGRVQGRGDLLQHLVDEVRLLGGAHQAAICLREERSWRTSTAAVSLSAKYARNEAPSTGRSARIATLVLEHGSPMLMTRQQLESHPHWTAFDAHLAEHPPLRGWLAAPMFGRDGKTIGVLQLSDKYEGDFDDQDLAVVQQMAQLAASAFETEAALQSASTSEAQAHAELTEQRQLGHTKERAAAELLRSNRDLQNFAFAASHDLQEPLRRIQHLTDQLQIRQCNRLGPEGLEQLLRVGQATQRMQGMLDDLLSYARIGLRSQPFAPVELDEVLSDVLADLEESIQLSGAQVVLQPLPCLHGDAEQMHTVFLNLLGNALKFTAAGQAPRLHVSGTTLAARAPGALEDEPHVELRVSDGGIGIDATNTARIFMPFQRLHSDAEYEGSGIGLAVVKKIVESHRGSVQVLSTVGRGSTFILRLPLHQHGPTRVGEAALPARLPVT